MRRRIFRRRRAVRRHNPVSWRLAWDLSQYNQATANFFLPATPWMFQAVTSPLTTVREAWCGGGDAYAVAAQLQPCGATPVFSGSTSLQIVSKTDLDFYEDELTIVRLMGWLRLHFVCLPDLVGVPIGEVEVRAVIYKTWEQETSTAQKVGILCPFNASSVEGRILWMTSWRSLVEQATPVNIGPAGFPGIGERHLSVGTLVQNESYRVRRVNIARRNPIKLKGNERLSLAVWVGPIPSAGAGSNQAGAVYLSGFARMLVRH